MIRKYAKDLLESQMFRKYASSRIIMEAAGMLPPQLMGLLQAIIKVCSDDES